MYDSQRTPLGIVQYTTLVDILYMYMLLPVFLTVFVLVFQDPKYTVIYDSQLSSLGIVTYFCRHTRCSLFLLFCHMLRIYILSFFDFYDLKYTVIPNGPRLGS